MAPAPPVSAAAVSGGEDYSLTISAPQCSTSYGLSTPLLMCEEITLFLTPVEKHVLRHE